MPLLRRLLQQKVTLDLIFLDPPYKDQLAYETVLRFLAEHSILREDAIVVVEHSRRYSLPEPEPSAAALSPDRTRRGSSNLLSLQYKNCVASLC